jgi:hypothetical protein
MQERPKMAAIRGKLEKSAHISRCVPTVAVVAPIRDANREEKCLSAPQP